MELSLPGAKVRGNESSSYHSYETPYRTVTVVVSDTVITYCWKYSGIRKLQLHNFLTHDAASQVWSHMAAHDNSSEIEFYYVCLFVCFGMHLQYMPLQRSRPLNYSIVLMQNKYRMFYPMVKVKNWGPGTLCGLEAPITRLEALLNILAPECNYSTRWMQNI